MYELLKNTQFLLVSLTNLCLFLVVSTWSFLPVFIVNLGGNNFDVGLVMGSIGVTSLGALPLLAPLIDRFGRKIFILTGIFIIGVSNACFLLFDAYSPLMMVVRLVQGVAFAACFNGCATFVADIVPPDKRAQGFGLFGVSGSTAVAIGPYVGETLLLHWGFPSYFWLLVGFGMLGFCTAIMVQNKPLKRPSSKPRGFFPTAFRDGHLAMMAVAAVCGSGFAAMNTFYPLHVRNLGYQAGAFFVCYGVSLVLVRVLLGALADNMRREKLIFYCILGFGLLLFGTSHIASLIQTILLGALFGLVQGLSYPAMMARMVDRSNEGNRAVVVSLFTGSFGVGINVSVLGWGYIANQEGLAAMFLIGGVLMFAAAAIFFWQFMVGKPWRGQTGQTP
ncbi:MAG: MFS transporter [Desulfomonilaceae bacterium]